MWADGTTRRYDVRWDLKPSLTLSPPAVVLKPSGLTSTVTVSVRSDRLAFRVVRVTSPLLAAEPAASTEARTIQVVRMDLDTDRIAPGSQGRVEIETDHPDQKTLTLEVMFLPRDKGASE